MGLLDFFTGGATKGAAELTKSVTDGVKDIAMTFRKTLPPDQKADFDLKMTTLEADILKAQTEVNKIEAASSRFFVAGWRPYLGWLLGTAIGINVLIRPILMIWNIEIPDLPTVAFILMSGLLGIAWGGRTLEKFRDVQNKH